MHRRAIDCNDRPVRAAAVGTEKRDLVEGLIDLERALRAAAETDQPFYRLVQEALVSRAPERLQAAAEAWQKLGDQEKRRILQSRPAERPRNVFRRFPRIELALGVRVEVKSGAAPKTARGETSNVSRRGVFLRIEPPPPIGSRLRLVIELRKGKTVLVEGTVVHQGAPAGPAGAGVSLHSVEDGWTEFVESLEGLLT